MELGTYTDRPITFSDYAVLYFAPHLYCGQYSHLMGCGATALSLISGEEPGKIKMKHDAEHFSDRFMVQYLRKNGFQVLKLTLCILSETLDSVASNHVVLVSQLVAKNLATWGVIFNSRYYHNFSIYHLDSLSFLNKPLLSAYLVTHPNWRAKQEHSRRPKRK